MKKITAFVTALAFALTVGTAFAQEAPKAPAATDTTKEAKAPAAKKHAKKHHVKKQKKEAAPAAAAPATK
jgi:hypothetical protein